MKFKVGDKVKLGLPLGKYKRGQIVTVKDIEDGYRVILEEHIWFNVYSMQAQKSEVVNCRNTKLGKLLYKDIS